MTLIEHLLSLALLWTEATGRSLPALGTLVANDGKFFGRIQSGQRATTETFEKFLSFFRSGESWPDGRIPLAATELLDNFTNIATEQSANGSDAQSEFVGSHGSVQ